MLTGLVLRLLRPSMRVVFTSAAQRQHSRYTDFLMSKVDQVVATSAQSASFVRAETVVVPHGVDTDRFAPASKGELRHRLNLDHGSNYVGVFGAVRWSKGTDLFIEAMLRVLGDRPSWRAIVVGNVVPRQRDFASALKQRVEVAGLSERITFLGHVDDARDFIRAVDICVAPSRNEGFGLTPLEAMSSGVPVVASSAGSYAETVKHDSTGLLFETGDARSLEQSVVALMDDDLLRRRLGTAGREHVVASHSVRREAETLLDIYCSLARSRRDGSR